MEQECQALQTRIKRYEEKISELQMSHAVLQEKLKKQDIQTKKIISQLQAENNHLRNGRLINPVAPVGEVSNGELTTSPKCHPLCQTSHAHLTVLVCSTHAKS